MKTGISLFKSKVAKRIFILFLLCAIIPIAVFSYLSFTQVSTQLREQCLTRLQNTAKSYGLILFERLTFLESELDIHGTAALMSARGIPGSSNDISFPEGMQNHFNSVAFIADSGPMIPLLGEMEPLPDDLMKLFAGNPSPGILFHYRQTTENLSRIFIAKPVSIHDGHPGYLVGDINAIYLWGIGYENILPPMTDACVLDHTRNTLFTSFQIPSEVLHQIRFESNNLESRSIEYSSGDDGYFIAYWPMFLKSRFDGPNLIVVLRNLHKDVFAPLSYFKVLFPMVTLLAFWIVLLLSTISIRRSMVPLEKLKEGAIRLARRDFNARVKVSSGDEFEALADTFNDSAASLGRQFNAMEAMAEIDRAVHASLNTKNIIITALKRMFPFFTCDSILIGLLDKKKRNIMRVFSCTEPAGEKLSEDFLKITPEDSGMLSEQFDYLDLEVTDRTPSFIPPGLLQAFRYFFVLPVYYNKSIDGIICLGHKDKYIYTSDDIAHAKRLSNQVSAALSNAFLVEELELLNWGTLEALARTVDAKSKWTAGHSERVAEMSVKIARVMGLDAKTIDTLHRGAYLHDIGKIGISLRIIDKPGKLSDEEFDKIKEHPSIGAKIIEPIEAYEDAIPMILQHHEHYDGKGYPLGLSGEDISLGGRILAVADVYDALVSSRPYRQGWVKEQVIDLITKESGTHFDPKVVDAFLSAVSWSVNDILSEAGKT